MIIGGSFLIVSVLIIVIWVFIEITRLKHKLFAIFLIGLILFSYISFSTIFKEKDIDYTTVEGLMDISKIYFSWLFAISGNFKVMTTNAIKMDWGVNQSEDLRLGKS